MEGIHISAAEEYSIKRRRLEKTIADDVDFLSKIGIPGHTKGHEEDSRTMQLVGDRIQRNKDAISRLEIEYRPGKNLE